MSERVTITFEKLDDQHFVVMRDGKPYCVHEYAGTVRVLPPTSGGRPVPE